MGAVGMELVPLEMGLWVAWFLCLPLQLLGVDLMCASMKMQLLLWMVWGRKIHGDNPLKYL